jgi:hypothetical protein
VFKQRWHRALSMSTHSRTAPCAIQLRAAQLCFRRWKSSLYRLSVQPVSPPHSHPPIPHSALRLAFPSHVIPHAAVVCPSAGRRAGDRPPRSSAAGAEAEEVARRRRRDQQVTESACLPASHPLRAPFFPVRKSERTPQTAHTVPPTTLPAAANQATRGAQRTRASGATERERGLRAGAKKWRTAAALKRRILHRTDSTNMDADCSGRVEVGGPQAL